MQNVHPFDRNRIQEVANWFHENIKGLLEASPYLELIDPEDTAGYIHALLRHAAFAAIAEPLRSHGLVHQIAPTTATIAHALFQRLNELLLQFRTQFPPTTDIERN